MILPSAAAQSKRSKQTPSSVDRFVLVTMRCGRLGREGLMEYHHQVRLTERARVISPSACADGCKYVAVRRRAD